VLDGGAASPDGRALVLVRVDDSTDGASLWVSEPPGAPLQRYQGAPATTKRLRRAPLRFSHDGRKLLAVFSPSAGSEQEWWLLKWPPTAGTAQRLFASGPLTYGLTVADWLDDNRNLLVSRVEEGYVGGHLWLADTVTGRWWGITTDPVGYYNPRVSRDGRVLVESVDEEEHILTIPLDGEPVRRLDQSKRRHRYPCFSPVSEQMLWVSDERGSPEIWVAGPAGEARLPAVTQVMLQRFCKNKNGS
jgi:hypothetical protein